jgi:hypothetical protein
VRKPGFDFVGAFTSSFRVSPSRMSILPVADPEKIGRP